VYLCGLTVWRWVWLARLQYDVQRDLQGLPPDRRFWRRLPAMLQLRLASNVAITWASIVVIPAFYGLYLGCFATPLLMDGSPAEPALDRVRRGLSWVHRAARRLTRVLVIMVVLWLVLTVAIFVGQAALVGTVLPSLTGIDAADLSVTLDSWPWRLRVLYFGFLVLDAFWTVAAVFLFYDSQSRRMATDLRARLRAITSGERGTE
jgi:hypothetical protein